MLKIDGIRLYCGVTPCDTAFSYGTATSYSFCVAELFAGDHVGCAEALHAAKQDCADFGRRLIGADALRLDRNIPPVPFTWQKSVVRELYSMALHDLVARVLGVPLHVLLGGLRRDRVRMMACIFPKSPEHAGAVTRRFVGQGFTALKVKIFAKPELDLAIIRAVRKELPNGFLQADANLGYKGLRAAKDILPQLAEAGLDVAEDPADISLPEYAELMAISPRPKIMLDANTRGDEAIGEVARLRCCDAANLHPNMQGTFSDVRDRAAAVGLAGLGVQIGGTGYTGVGAFAHLHVAGVYGEQYPFGEIGGWLDHGVPVSTATAPLPIANGFATVPTTPGHGGEISRAFLASMSETIEIGKVR